jgi:amidase
MELFNIPIITLQKLLNDKIISSYDITSYFINRIKTIDQKYHAVYMINPDALSIAKKLDLERESGKVRSLMHGIPVLLKDNINTADQQTTTAGTNILKDHKAQEDATLVKTLRSKGAIILGKTNLTELACYKTFIGSNGFSSLGGQVLFPYDINEDPSGSSTGSAVATALRLSPVSIGTETGGSIMSPAMRNGIVALKPTIGLIPRTGIIPISSTLDTAGPMANHISDISILLSSMVSHDPKDPITMTQQHSETNYTSYLETHDVKRIGLVTNSPFAASSDEKHIYKKICKLLKSLGYELIEIEVPLFKSIDKIMKYEFKHDINKYLKDEKLNITLNNIISYNKKYPKENLKYGQGVLLEAENETSGLKNEQIYLDALLLRKQTINEVNAIFEKNQIDVMYFINYTHLGPACGYPTLTLPVDYNKKGLPKGLYLLAPHYKEGHLIELGYQIETNINQIFTPLKSLSE